MSLRTHPSAVLPPTGTLTSNPTSEGHARLPVCPQSKTQENILAAVNNNLNSAEAFAVIDNSELTLEDWKFVDALFGLKLIEETPDIAAEDYKLIKKREQARSEKDFQTADEIRAKLAEKGIGIKDEPGGAMWEYLQ